MKVTVVGAGMVGSTTALRLLDDRVARTMVVVDVVEGLAKAVALDLGQSGPLRGHTVDITGGADYGPTEGSDLVIVTAGVPRKPGQSRADLMAKNSGIVRDVVEEVVPRSPQAILVVVTNPLDEMTTLAWRLSGFPPHRVLGMAGALDTARFRYFVAKELHTSPEGVEAIVLGSHGETMVPLPRLARVTGLPLTELLPPNRLSALVERTREAGAEIVALLQRGSAWFAPSAAIADMAAAIGRDEHRVVSASAYLQGQYGLSDVFLGVPVRLGRRGVEDVVELALEPAELAALRAAAETIRARVADLDGAAEAMGGPAGSPGRAGMAAEERHPVPVGPVAGPLGALRLQSRVRRAVEQVLWERGAPPAEGEADRLTEAVLERLGRTR